MIACALIAAALATVAPGAVLQAEGTCPAALRVPSRDFGGVVLDMTAAAVPDGMVGRGFTGLAVRGGVWGRADAAVAAYHTIQVTGVADFSLAGATVLGNGDAKGGGISITGSTRVTVRDSVFAGHATAIGVTSSAAVLVTGNRITGSAADGINITDVQQAVVSANSCREFAPAVGAHPDCIQLRDLPLRPRQSEIWVLNNEAVGQMQAFFGHCHRATFAGNYAAISGYTHTVTCSLAVESAAFDNVLSNAPDAVNGPGSLKGFGAGNWAARNLVWDARAKGWAPRRWSTVVPPIWQQVGSRFEDRRFSPDSVEVAR